MRKGTLSSTLSPADILVGFQSLGIFLGGVEEVGIQASQLVRFILSQGGLLFELEDGGSGFVVILGRQGLLGLILCSSDLGERPAPEVGRGADEVSADAPSSFLQADSRRPAIINPIQERFMGCRGWEMPCCVVKRVPKR